MPLTRPLINNLNTNVEVFNDTITVLHGNASVANADIGLLMNRAGGLVANVALYWNESSQSFITAYTSSDGVSYSNIAVTSYANLTVGNIINYGNFTSNGTVISNTVNAATIGNTGAVHTGSTGTFTSWANVTGTATSTSTSTGALVVAGGAGIAGNLYVGGNVSASNFLGNIFFGPTPTTTYYTQAPLNLTNSLAGGIKTQLNLINTGGGGGAGAGIDFYTYTSVAGSTYPEARIAVVDDGNYSGYITFQTKIPGNTGANALAERLKIDSAGNLVIPTTTTSISTTTGALVVKGGVGVVGNIYVGGIYIGAGGTNGLYWSANNSAVSTGGGGGAPGGSTAQIQYNNAGSFAGATNLIYFNGSGNVLATAGTTSTSTTTGALVVTGSGGIGVGGDTYIGGNVFYGPVPILNGSSTTTSISTTPTAIDTFATATYRGAKYLVSTTDVTNTQYQMAEVILTQDGTSVGVSVYGVSYTGTSLRMTFTANISLGTLTLWGTGVSANNTVKLQRTLIPV